MNSLKKDEFRDAYLSRKIKSFLAAQIRALRGALTQTAFGKEIGKPQSVISRLEKENFKGIHLQTLIDIAKKKKVGLLVRFVPFDEFLRYTQNYSEEAIEPNPYDQTRIEGLAAGTLVPSSNRHTIAQPLNMAPASASQAERVTTFTLSPSYETGNSIVIFTSPPVPTTNYLNTVTESLATVGGNIFANKDGSTPIISTSAPIMPTAIMPPIPIQPNALANLYESMKQTSSYSTIQAEFGRLTDENMQLKEQNERFRLALLTRNQLSEQDEQLHNDLWQRGTLPQTQEAPKPV